MSFYAHDQIFLLKVPSQEATKQKPLVLLHGWGRDHQALLSLAHLLCQQRDIYLIDLPGFGKSPLPPIEQEVPSYVDIANWTLKRLQQEGVTSFDLLGHSFGGKVAIALAKQHPEIKNLILMASSGIKAKRPFLKKIKFLLLKYSAKILKRIDYFLGSCLFTDWFRPKFGSKDYLAAGPMRAILVRSVQEDITSELFQLKTSTLLLWGERDTETPLEMAVRMQKIIPKAQLISLPFAGHLLAEESPSLCAHFIEKFLLDRSLCS